MKTENEKKGLFDRLNEKKKVKKNSCCCGFEVEAILPEEDNENKSEKKSQEGKGNSCCR